MKAYFSTWNFMRYFRLGIGLLILIQGIHAMEWIIIAMGAIFTVFAFTNTGCGINGSCSVTSPRQTRYPKQSSTAVDYEEVK